MLKTNKLVSILFSFIFISLSFSTVILANNEPNISTTSTIKLSSSVTPSIKISRTENPQETIRISNTEIEHSIGLKDKPGISGIKKPETERELKCQNTSTKIDGLSEKYNNAKTEDSKRFERSVTSISDLILKLKQKGINTTDLENELVVLKGKVAKYTSDVQALTDYLKTIKTDMCVSITPTGTPSVSTSSKSTKARQLLAVIKTDVDDIRNYFKNVIKPTLEDIKKQKLETTPTTSITPVITTTETTSR